MNLSPPTGLDAVTALARALESSDRYAVIDERHGIELGFYAPRGKDPQGPHDRDELYFIASGSGTFRRGEEVIDFGPGDALFVPAGQPHRFERFDDDFGTWVLFYGSSD